MDDGELRERWAFYIRPTLTGAASDTPDAAFLGAQPGAGKTRIAQQLAVSMPGLLIIDGDDFRHYHPDYARCLAEDPRSMPARTAAAAGRWIQMSIEHAIANSWSYLVHGTWRTTAVVMAGVELAHHHRYRTHAVAVAVPAEVSRRAIRDRYLDAQRLGLDPRWTPPQIHDQAVTQLPESVRVVAGSPLVDWFAITDRAGGTVMKPARWSDQRAATAAALFATRTTGSPETGRSPTWGSFQVDAGTPGRHIGEADPRQNPRDGLRP